MVQIDSSRDSGDGDDDPSEELKIDTYQINTRPRKPSVDELEEVIFRGLKPIFVSFPAPLGSGGRSPELVDFHFPRYGYTNIDQSVR